MLTGAGRNTALSELHQGATSMLTPSVPFTRIFLRAGLASLIAGFVLSAAHLPNPATDENRSEKKSETAVFAGGCFWGVEAVFDAVKGVKEAVAGYAGGSKANAHYEIMS